MTQAKKLTSLLVLAGALPVGIWLASSDTQDADAQAQPTVSDAAHTSRAVPLARTSSPEAAPTPVPDELTPAADSSAMTYAGQRIVRLTPGADAQAVASELGLTLLESGRPGRLALMSGDDAELSGLTDHPDVVATAANGIMRGASSGSALTGAAYTPAGSGSLMAHQWHLETIDLPANTHDHIQHVTVAVLDSGVAYRTWCDDGPCDAGETPTHAQAESLAAVTVVSPADFVDDDLVPLDEHQHGTHIATTILGDGALRGVAAGAKLMPIRVLDEHNQGSEYDLVQGILHAIDEGAHIANMSLAFAPGYAPSPFLLEALRDAHDAGLLMIAASGNNGEETISWPAQSPYVVAVGASEPGPRFDKMDNTNTSSGIARATGYMNKSVAVDILAPGGNLSADYTGDGHPDGILAETIPIQDPSSTAPYFMEGTSQAAAVATGVAARVMARAGGADAEGTANALLAGSRALDARFAKGTGRGHVRAYNSELLMHRGDAVLDLSRDVRVSVLPYLERAPNGKVRPAARLTAFDGTDGFDDSVKIGVRFASAGGTALKVCQTNADDACTVYGPPQTLGSPTGHAWSVSVEGVIYDDRIVTRPTGVLFGTDALEAIVTAAHDEGVAPAAHGIGLWWQEGTDADLGELAASFVFLSGGTGLATSPIGVIATPAAVLPGVLQDDPLGTGGSGLATSPIGIATLDLPGTLASQGSGLATSPIGIIQLDPFDIGQVDGTGLATSPIGFTGVTFDPFDLNLDGTGLATSPIGFVPVGIIGFDGLTSDGSTVEVMTIDGSGLATSPIGLHGGDLLQPGGGGIDLPGVNMEDGAAVYDVDDGAGGVLMGTSLGDQLDAGGFVSANGQDVGALLAQATASAAASGQATSAPISLDGALGAAPPADWE